jgi:transporter family protein
MWGGASFLEKWGLERVDPLSGVLVRSAGVVLGTVVFAWFSPASRAGALKFDVPSALCLMGGGIMASVLGQVFFYRALKTGEVGRVAAVGGAWPVVAFLLSLAFLGEPFTLKKGAGVGLVLTGVFLLK